VTLHPRVARRHRHGHPNRENNFNDEVNNTRRKEEQRDFELQRTEEGIMEGVEEWRSGGVEEWRSGGVEEWRSGEVEEWREKRCEAKPQ